MEIICIGTAVGRKSPLKDVYDLILGNCEYITQQRRIKVTDGMKFANQLTLRWGSSLDYPGGPNLVTRSW